MKKCIMKFLYKIMLDKVFKPFTHVNIKPLPLVINKTDNCLVLAPHPDDESIGCGGILNIYPDNFEVICLTCNNDAIRHQEFDSAMSLVGVKHSMLSLKDKNVLDGFDGFKEIDILNRDYIFIPYIYDQHRDHKAVSVLLNKLLAQKKHKSDLKIAFYEVWSAMNMPTHFLDVSKVWAKKEQCINVYVSQGGTEYTQKIGGLNSYRGLLKRIPYAEAFTVLDVSDFKNLVEYLT